MRKANENQIVSVLKNFSAEKTNGCREETIFVLHIMQMTKKENIIP